MVCHSKVGCAAIFRTNEASQQLGSYRTCLNTTSVCSYHESGLHVFCCYDSMCNEPSSDHVTSGLTTVPPNTVPITIPPTTKEPETTEDLPVDTASSSIDVYPSSTVLGVGEWWTMRVGCLKQIVDRGVSQTGNSISMQWLVI